MRKIILGVIATLWLGCSLSHAASPDTSSMPQLVLPQATPPEDVSPDGTPTGPQFTASATTASNYIFRGVSQTENHPAVFGATRVTDDQFYAGAGIENVDFHNSTDAEYDLSGGWTPVVEGFRLDLGMIRYGYIDEPDHTHIDTVDFKGVVLHDFGPATFAVAVFYTADYFGSHHDGIYTEGRTSYKITDELTAGGALGRQTVDAGLDHTTWNAGLNYAFTKNFSLDARYYDTNEHNLGTLYRSHFVGAIKASL